MPSGNPLTTTINCLVVQIIYRYSWIKVHNYDIRSIIYYSDNVAEVVYGDDSIATVSDKASTIFGMAEVTAGAKEMGYIFTSADKVEGNVEFKSIEDLEFLKRGFRYDNVVRRVVAPLRLQTILEIPFWVKSKKNIHAQMMTNVEVALSELSLHGREIYDEWSRIICKHVWDCVGVNLHVREFEQAIRETTTEISQQEFLWERTYDAED